jgi:Rrf2 family transcriptional regulator, nitric oxide-sensitive transcriptional repressor
LFELVEIIEGPSSLVKCISEEGACDIESSCNISSPIKSLNNKLNTFFKNIPLSELMSSGPDRVEDLSHV